MLVAKIFFLLMISKVYSLTFQPIEENDIKRNERNESVRLKPDFIELLSTQLEVIRFGIENMRLKMEILDYKTEDIKETFLKSSSANFKKEILQRIGSRNSRYSELVSKVYEAEIASDQQYDKHLNCLSMCEPFQQVPSSCTEATSASFLNDGVYVLSVPHVSELSPFYAYCLHKDEVAWTIIQRREDGSENFYRNWLDYKLGFGNLNGEYWIGLERLHAMTTNHKHELWINMEDYAGNEKYARYSIFSVASEDEGYKLTLGGYSGDAGDSFAYHANMKFSTFDHDNDEAKKNCAQNRKGGWWYKACYHSNLNGPYFSYADRNRRYGINWIDWHGLDESLRYTHMAIRPL